MKKKSFFNSLKERSFLLSGIFSFFALVLGIIGAVTATAGICIFCLIPALTFVLGLVGLSTGTLLFYNKYFILAGIFFIALSIYLYKHKRSCDDEKFCNLK